MEAVRRFPDLLAEVRALEESNRRLRAALANMVASEDAVVDAAKHRVEVVEEARGRARGASPPAISMTAEAVFAIVESR